MCKAEYARCPCVCFVCVCIYIYILHISIHIYVTCGLWVYIHTHTVHVSHITHHTPHITHHPHYTYIYIIKHHTRFYSAQCIIVGVEYPIGASEVGGRSPIWTSILRPPLPCSILNCPVGRLVVGVWCLRKRPAFIGIYIYICTPWYSIHLTCHVLSHQLASAG